MSFSPHVLLAEDSQDDVFFFERALKRALVDCQLTHVSDGAAAIEHLQRACQDEVRMPDLVFLDLKMPIMTGFDVLEWLRNQTFKLTPSVIVLSGSNQDTDRRRAQQLGARDYLVKPVTAEELAKRVQDIAVSGAFQTAP